MEHTRFIGLDTWIFTKNGFRSQWRRAGARGRWNTSAKLPMSDRLRLPKRRARISAFVHWRTGVIQAAFAA
jgi:hypothetical protein